MMGFGLIFIILLVVAVAYTVGWQPQTSMATNGESSSSALDTLKARYARGEISKTDYEAIRDTLRD